jgi:putative transposase
MPNYHRPDLPGGTFFITIVTFKRMPILTNSRARRILHDSWEVVGKRFPFTTDAICLLPEHIHALITLPEDDANISIRIREIKRLFTKAYLAQFGESLPRNQSRIKKGEATVWQRRFYDHAIRDERDLETHVEYIHYNPVKHGLVDRVSDWEWSSFHRYVKDGLYLPDWGEGIIIKNDKKRFGE